MSRRNSREAKARRRAERAATVTVDVMAGVDVLRAAAEHQTLPCGCDAHDLLYHSGWQWLDREGDESP